MSRRVRFGIAAIGLALLGCGTLLSPAPRNVSVSLNLGAVLHNGSTGSENWIPVSDELVVRARSGGKETTAHLKIDSSDSVFAVAVEVNKGSAHFEAVIESNND